MYFFYLIKTGFFCREFIIGNTADGSMCCSTTKGFSICIFTYCSFNEVWTCKKNRSCTFYH